MMLGYIMRPTNYMKIPLRYSITEFKMGMKKNEYHAGKNMTRHANVAQKQRLD